MDKKTGISTEEILNRPFRIKAKAEAVNTKNHPDLTYKIKKLLNHKIRFSVELTYQGNVILAIVIGNKDGNNANFNEDDDCQIFVGIVDSKLFSKELKFNDMIEFQSCDVINLIFTPK